MARMGQLPLICVKVLEQLVLPQIHDHGRRCRTSCVNQERTFLHSVSGLFPFANGARVAMQ